MLEKAFQSRTFFAFAGIGPVTAVAVVIKNPATGGLLGIEAEFGVRLAALHVATCEDEERERYGEARRNATAVVVHPRSAPLLRRFRYSHILRSVSHSRGDSIRLTMIEES